MRATDIVDYAAPFMLVDDTCYAEDDGSLKEDLIKRASHSHPMFKEDNAAVHHMLEEANRSKVCSTSLKPLQRKKDGRNTLLSTVKHHAGDDQRKRPSEKPEDFINSKV